MTIALVGQPNSGKTTLYNWITGSKFKTVNYPGATVEYHLGNSLPQYGAPIEVMDTPGIRSLDPLSADEELTIQTLKGQVRVKRPERLIVPVDACQLSRHLILVLQLKEAGYPLVVALTMLDLLKEKKLTIDVQSLQRELGVPVVEVDGRLGGGVDQLLRVCRNLAVDDMNVELKPWTRDRLEQGYVEVDRIVEKVSLVRDGATKGEALAGAHPATLAVDRYFLQPVLGPLIFMLIMTGLFISIYSLSTPLMDLLDGMFSSAAAQVTALPWGLGSQFLGEGLIASLGAVFVFVPQIFILFFGMALLEESGYLARAAVIIDKPLALIGLSGRSFVPLLSGYACAIPAMLAARTINSKKEKWLAVFIIPLLSCSARLPVYALLLGFLFPEQPIKAGVGLMLLYLASLVVAALVSLILDRLVQLEGRSFFMLELPAYRRPQLKVVLRLAFDRTRAFVMRAGPVIVVISILVWGLLTFPNYQVEDSVERTQSSYLAQMGQWMEPAVQPMGVDWRVGVGMLSAFAAREVFVSTMALMFHISDDSEEGMQKSLLKSMREARFTDGRPIFSVGSVVGLLFFFMVSLQCLSTFAVAVREAQSRYFAWVQLISFNIMGYVGAVILYQVISRFTV